MKLLLIEDEKNFAASIITYLKDEGYLSEAVFNYEDASDKVVVGIKSIRHVPNLK